jgi:hypothetical protein
VRFLDSIEPNLKSLQMAARDGLFPGAEEGIENLLQRLPEVRAHPRDRDELGNLAAEAGAQLGGPKFDAFFKYLRTDGVKILDDTAARSATWPRPWPTCSSRSVVSRPTSPAGCSSSPRAGRREANLSTNAGFQEFLDYIETEGPHALETLGSVRTRSCRSWRRRRRWAARS